MWNNLIRHCMPWWDFTLELYVCLLTNVKKMGMFMFIYYTNVRKMGMYMLWHNPKKVTSYPISLQKIKLNPYITVLHLANVGSQYCYIVNTLDDLFWTYKGRCQIALNVYIFEKCLLSTYIISDNPYLMNFLYLLGSKCHAVFSKGNLKRR